MELQDLRLFLKKKLRNIFFSIDVCFTSRSDGVDEVEWSLYINEPRMLRNFKSFSGLKNYVYDVFSESSVREAENILKNEGLI